MIPYRRLGIEKSAKWFRLASLFALSSNSTEQTKYVRCPQQRQGGSMYRRTSYDSPASKVFELVASVLHVVSTGFLAKFADSEQSAPDPKQPDADENRLNNSSLRDAHIWTDG
ncbi:hypothetical protein PINS_up006641 [Pythium insidiosum]|nr:hypothetical protein PINS_up006641 [Pythium insidiosum]